MTDKYKPINCDFYDHFEIFSMRQNWLHLSLKEDIQYNAIKIKSLKTEDKSEFAILSDEAKIRLDQVLEIRQVPLESLMGQALDKLDFNLWANKRILSVIKETKEAEKINRLFSHIINAHHIWNRRMANSEYSFGIWQVHDYEELNSLIEINHSNSINSLNGLELDEYVNYTDTQNKKGRSTTQQIISHIVNHGTYHRGQIIQLLQESNEQTIVTGYIDFVS